MKEQDVMFDKIDFICLLLIPIVFTLMIEFSESLELTIKSSVVIFGFYGISYLALRTTCDKINYERSLYAKPKRLLSLYKLNK